MTDKEISKEEPLKVPHKIPTVAAPTQAAITVPGSSDYVRLRGLREHGYYILPDA